VEKLSVSSGPDGFCRAVRNGRLNEFPAAVSGELGPLAALSGRNSAWRFKRRWAT
jgi:hypothetical protein